MGCRGRKLHTKIRKPLTDSEEGRRDRAVELIYQHNIGKNINILKGFGRADPDDPVIGQQMLDKHPAAIIVHAADWTEIPASWFYIAREYVVSEAMLPRITKVIRETDPTTGVGPRGLHYNYLVRIIHWPHVKSRVESRARSPW